SDIRVRLLHRTFSHNREPVVALRRVFLALTVLVPHPYNSTSQVEVLRVLWIAEAVEIHSITSQGLTLAWEHLLHRPLGDIHGVGLHRSSPSDRSDTPSSDVD